MADLVPILLDDLWAVRKSHRDKATKLLLKIFNNISTNAENPKYRRLNLQNIQRRAPQCPQLAQLIHAAGFVNTDETHVFLNDSNMDVMLAVQALLQEKVDEENAELEAERARIMEESRQRQAAYEAEHNRGRDVLRKKITNARKQNADNHVSVGSTATKLKFGRVDKQVEFSTGGGG